MMKDTVARNAIIQRDGIVLIDPDNYEFSTQDISSVKDNNYKELLYLLKTIFIEYSELNKKDISDFFEDLEDEDSLETIYYIEKELKRVKRPLDLFNSKCLVTIR